MTFIIHVSDHEPAIVITHGDLLSLSERAGVRVYLGEILGVHPCKQTFDIPDNDEPTTELTIVDLVRYAALLKQIVFYRFFLHNLCLPT